MQEHPTNGVKAGTYHLYADAVVTTSPSAAHAEHNDPQLRE